jgi:hypothetical protein
MMSVPRALSNFPAAIIEKRSHGQVKTGGAHSVGKVNDQESPPSAVTVTTKDIQIFVLVTPF